MTAFAPKTFDQFVKFASSCAAVVYVKTGATYTVAALPLDMVVLNVNQANFDKAMAAFPEMQEVASITQS